MLTISKLFLKIIYISALREAG